MAYRLQSLLKIRATREDRASADLAAARQAVAKARQEVTAREDELARFQKTRDERRDRIYSAVMGHAITRDELDLVREGVARIDQEGILKAQNVAEAKKVLSAKEDDAKSAKKVFVEASRDHTKILEHRSMWVAEENLAQEYRQETELEDFTGRKRDADNR